MITKKLNKNILWILIIIFSLIWISKAEYIYDYSSAESLREYCVKRFGNSDLWYPILRYNGYNDIDKIKIGTKIQIPVKLLLFIGNAEDEIHNKMAAVIKNGATLFAKEEMKAVRMKLLNFEDAFNNGEFSKAKLFIEQITNELNHIENICNNAQNHKIQAKIFDLKGEVDKQLAGKFSWEPVKINAYLQEQDKVRTMKSSFADIIFKDESHIFLEENSMMLIKKMRENRLKRENSSSVVLVKGDLQALLNPETHKNFNVDIPKVKTAIKSNYFWLERKKNKDVNIANYDGTIQVSSMGKAVTIKENEGVKVKYKKAPSNPVKLLNPPENLRSIKYNTLLWNKAPNAVKYQIQLATNQSFLNNIVFSKKTTSNRLIISDLNEGVYYWRIRSIDSNGLPGNYSQPQQIVYRIKHRKPYLFINKSIQGDSITLDIDTQIGNFITVNDYKVKADKQITKLKFPLKSGKNNFSVIVTSPSGLESSKVFSYKYLPKNKVTFSYAKQAESNLTEISGVFDKNYLIILNGKKYKTKDEKFKKIIKLNKGINQIPLKVIDEKSNHVIYSDTLRILLK